ncbi:efflux RND transporter periplasmic adaptor subunit [Zoogloea sp.]|uniref:efflux RND transporter periplasmic adaptor subunit n=1 Tax=Zoogloea sp. TaxID=49181 RepID=UPI0035AEF399
MKAGAGIAVGLAVALAAGGGYWFGQRPSAGPQQTSSPVAAVPTDGAKKERKLLYYRNPMGLPDTSPTPKKDPMGMDYIPVYEGEADNEPATAGTVKISTDKVQKLGVRTEAAELRSLDRTVRAAGRVEIDERRSFAISPKFEGYVERLHVNVTGQPVAKGQPLFEVYSPELVSAQREYAIAAQGVEALKDAGSEAQSGMRQLAESSLLRLRNWDISEEQIRALAKSGATKRTLTFRSPVAGIVTEKKALQGMRFMPGEALYQVADLSSVWVVADVFEQDIGLIRNGSPAKVRINAYPDKVFEGKVSYVYPTLNAETRTVPVRVELPNPGLQLKPAMFAQLELPVGGRQQVVTVPNSAVIDSGTRQIVLVAHGEGRFEPREVKLGSRSENHIEVLQGIKAGEQVVVAANFLIDAESNLKAALDGFGHADHNAKPAAAPVGHRTEGTVEGLDPKENTVTLSHDPVPSLKWPAMTMDFKLANPALQQSLKPGARVNFEFVERQPGEWVITTVKPVDTAPAAKAHAGH